MLLEKISPMESRTISWDIGGIWTQLEPLERICSFFPLLKKQSKQSIGSARLLRSGTQAWERIIKRANRFQKHSLHGHKSTWNCHAEKKKHTTYATEVSRFLFKSLYIRRLQKQFFFLPYKSVYFERYATVPMVILNFRLGHLCFY